MQMILLIDWVFTILITLLFPFILAFWFFKNYKKSWKIIGIGALSYFLINLLLGGIILLISFCNPDFPRYFLLIFFGLIPGILAAICEETARFFSLKLFLKKYFNWQNALLFGIGWGGIECILFGISKIYELFILNNESLFTFIFPFGISRIVAIFVQIALSVLMVQLFIKNKPIFFFYAISLHLFINISLNLISPLILIGGMMRYIIEILGWTIITAVSIIIISLLKEG